MKRFIRVGIFFSDVDYMGCSEVSVTNAHTMDEYLFEWTKS